MIDHVGIPVTDLAASRELYAVALAPLGYKVLYESDKHGIVGFGAQQPQLWLHHAVGGAAVHVAVTARRSGRSTKRRCPREPKTTGLPVRESTMPRATTPPTSTTSTATIWRLWYTRSSRAATPGAGGARGARPAPCTYATRRSSGGPPAAHSGGRPNEAGGRPSQSLDWPWSACYSRPSHSRSSS